MLDAKMMSCVLQNINGMLGWLDTDDHILGLNDTAVQLLGFQALDNAIGKTPYDLNCPAVECVDQFLEQDHYVIESRKSVQILDIHPYADGTKRFWLTTKTPLITDNIVIGTMYHCQPLYHDVLVHIGKILNADEYFSKEKQKCYIIDYKLTDFNLSIRQQECLYYLIRGKSAATIANILQLSKRTVESYIDEIKSKMYCDSKSAVIEKAINEGLLYCIPKNIFSGNISLMLLEKTENIKKVLLDSIVSH